MRKLDKAEKELVAITIAILLMGVFMGWPMLVFLIFPIAASCSSGLPFSDY